MQLKTRLSFSTYIKKIFEKQEAQKWWVGKSLQIFRRAKPYNISLEIEVTL